MSDLDVRIEELEPMRVACVRVVSESPEQDSWEKLQSWAEAKGYLGNVEDHPIFGFNNPSPSTDRKEYGYEFWIRVPPDEEPEGEIDIQDFPGGLYAVTTIKGLPNPDVWISLWKWVQSSPYEWRKTNELEKVHDPFASQDEIMFDLYLPIMK
jgi:AraC family transcriptional regulator